MSVLSQQNTFICCLSSLCLYLMLMMIVMILPSTAGVMFRVGSSLNVHTSPREEESGWCVCVCGVRENDTKRRGFIILSSKLLLVRVTAAFLPVAAPVWSWWCTWRRVASSLEHWRRQTGLQPPRWDGRHPSSSSLCPPHSWTVEQANTLLKNLTICALSLLIELAHTTM